MKNIRLMLADIDRHFTDTVSRYLSKCPGFEIVGCEHNGQEALRKIRAEHPDIVLFDIILPGLDGISLLRSARSLNNPPVMICCTRFNSDVALDASVGSGACYFMFKPVELQSLQKIIITCLNLSKDAERTAQLQYEVELDDNENYVYVRNHIVSMGIPSKLIGCDYLTAAVRMARKDMGLMHNLSKGLYLEIARSMNTTPTRVERCIRSAISAAHQSGYLADRMPTCPSNKEFINYTLRTLEI